MVMIFGGLDREAISVLSFNTETQKSFDDSVLKLIK